MGWTETSWMGTGEGSKVVWTGGIELVWSEGA